MKPISLQLYTLREAAKENFTKVLEDVAEIGYTGVEPAGFHGMTPREFRTVVEDLGMTVSSSHGPWIRGKENVQEAIDTAGELGIDLACSGFGKEMYATVDDVKKTAELVNSFVEPLKKAGISLFMHNHYWEYEKFDGRLAYDIFAELCPDVLFEIDAYWAANFGANDPAEEVRKLKDRMPLLHIKDGPLTKEDPMQALGQGKMDISAVIEAADENVLRWVIVELDRCATDMVTAVKESYTYLIENGLASGRK
jgi:sugar phosphate isomerase/epimerase